MDQIVVIRGRVTWLGVYHLISVQSVFIHKMHCVYTESISSFSSPIIEYILQHNICTDFKELNASTLQVSLESNLRL
ncbi:hypothetical protein C0J52_04330 [Blattella germanica]|nr:hypothetical protein C0J52_04330 [Blattella germanica]